MQIKLSSYPAFGDSPFEVFNAGANNHFIKNYKEFYGTPAQSLKNRKSKSPVKTNSVLFESLVSLL